MADASGFLKGLKGSTPVPRRTLTKEPSPAAEDRSGKLLDLLADGPDSTADLLRTSGMSLADYTETIEALTQAGFISLRDGPEGETAFLTDLGKRTASTG